MIDTELIEALEKSTIALEKAAQEMKTALQVVLILESDPRNMIESIDNTDQPYIPHLKRTIDILHKATERAQWIERRLMERITEQAGTSRLVISDVRQADERENK